MTILICSTKHGGCGHAGDAQQGFVSHEFFGVGDVDTCTRCNGRNVNVLDAENLDTLTDESNREIGRMLISSDLNVVDPAR